MIAIVFVKFASSHELAGLIADTEPMGAEFFSAKHDNFTAKGPGLLKSRDKYASFPLGQVSSAFGRKSNTFQETSIGNFNVVNLDLPD